MVLLFVAEPKIAGAVILPFYKKREMKMEDERIKADKYSRISNISNNIY